MAVAMNSTVLSPNFGRNHVNSCHLRNDQTSLRDKGSHICPQQMQNQQSNELTSVSRGSGELSRNVRYEANNTRISATLAQTEICRPRFLDVRSTTVERSKERPHLLVVGILRALGRLRLHLLRLITAGNFKIRPSFCTG